MAEQEPDQHNVTETETPELERPEQKVTAEDIGPARKKLTIELPESRIKAKIESSFEQLGNDAAVPGFRRGRAPRRLIERRFGASVRDDVKGQLLSEAYTQAIEDEKLDVLGEPDVKDIESIELPESGPMSFTVEVEVAPHVDLPAFDSLEVKRTKREVTDADVDTEIEQYRERFGKLVDAPDAAVEAGDFVMADVHVLAGENAGEDAEVIAHHHDTYILVPGESREYRGHVAGIIVEDLGKRLEGKKAGDTEAISMTGPSGHENEQIKDQPITLKVELKQVQRLEPAPVEQLVEQMGVPSEDELRSRVREMLEQRLQQEQQSDLHRQVCDQLLEKVTLELPEGLTGRQTERVLRRRAMELAYQGTPEQEVEQQLAEMRSGSEEEARRQLKLFFIIDQAAKNLEVEVADAEINGRIAMMAMQQGRRPEKLRQDMHRRGEIEQIYLQLREQKTLDKVLEKAKVTEVEGEPEAESKEKAAPKKKSTKKK